MSEIINIRLRNPVIACFRHPESRNYNDLLSRARRQRSPARGGRTMASGASCLYNPRENLLLIRCRLHNGRISMQFLIAGRARQYGGSARRGAQSSPAAPGIVRWGKITQCCKVAAGHGEQEGR